MIGIELTRLIKANGPLTKKLHLTAGGKLDNDSTQCQMATGRIERIQLDDWREFGPLIEATPRNVAWALGSMLDGLPDTAHLTVKDDPQTGQSGFVARTADNFIYRPNRPAFILIDFDLKGMPDDVKARIEALGGFAGALTSVAPAIADAGYIERRSTSAGVHNPETGETYPSEGRHLYLLAQDGADARRFLYALHDRAWLNDLGWHMVGKAGQMLERSIIDRMVCAPERLVFEAAPDLEAPLKQRERKATVHDRPPLDTKDACADLTARETAEIKRLKAASAEDKKDEAAKAKAAFVEERTAKLVARGVDPAKAKETAEARSQGVLKEDVTLEFDDRAIGTKTVADVLADPEAYIGKALADPIEGVEYGRQTAKVLRRPTGEVFINSYAHGGAQYRLVRDDDVINTRAPYDNAKLFQKSLGTPARYHRGAFYEWNGASWPEVDEDKLRSRLYVFLDRRQTRTAKSAFCAVKPNPAMVSGVLDGLRGAAYLDERIAPPAWLDEAEGPPAHEIVACANGLLHLPTRRLLPHSPSFFTLNALDYNYNPNAPPPFLWNTFLRDLWPEDKELVAALKQAFGYLLTSDTSQQKAFLIIGPRRSGKGTIGRVLARFVGLHNFVAPTLASLSLERFALAPLIGKPLAVVSDARLSGRADQQVIVERLLSITGEDGQTIDRKFNPRPWTGTLPTRFVILANQLPRLDDASGALAGRFILMLLTKSFYGREDRGLTNKLLEELPSILNWALDGWDELQRVGCFIQPASAKEAMEQLEDLASPIGAFVRERCEIGPAFCEDVEKVFKAWADWCLAQRRDHTGTVQAFGRDLRAAVPGLTIIQPRIDGGRVRSYQGLRLKQGAPSQEEDGDGESGGY